MDAKTESVAPAVMKSERTRSESDYVSERKAQQLDILLEDNPIWGRSFATG